MTAAEIQQKIDEAFNQGGGAVVLPAETHVLDTALRLKPGVALRGASRQAVLTTKDPNANLIELVSGNGGAAHDVEISNLQIKGPGTHQDITKDVSDDPEKGCGIFVSTVGDHKEVSNVVIQGCHIENVSGSGIHFRSRHDVLVKDVTIKKCTLHQNRRPPENGKSQSYKDIFFYGTRFENIRVEGNSCTFTPNRSSPYGNDSGIAFVINRKDCGGCFVKNVHLIGNTCSGHRRHGIITNYGSMPAFDVEVRRNTCTDNRWVGIYVNTNIEEGRNVTIEDNTCDHNGYGGSSDPTAPDKTIRGGIVLSGCYNSQINNNHCNSNGCPSKDFSGADASAKHAPGIRVRGKNLTLKRNEARKNKGGDVEKWPEPYENVKEEGTKKDFFLRRLFRKFLC